MNDKPKLKVRIAREVVAATIVVGVIYLMLFVMALRSLGQPDVFVPASPSVANYTSLTVISNTVNVIDSTTNILITTNVYFTQNISVSGKATLQTVIITNSLLYSTNAFPLAAGTTWDWSRYHQFISTNADFNITAIGGLSNSLLNNAELRISNAAASTIICHLQFALSKFGPNTTNDVYIPSHKQAYVNGQVEGIGSSTNIVTLVEQ